MKKITFDELCQLVSEVDYLCPNTFPISFDVDGVEYCVGIGSFDDCGTEDDVENIFCGLTDELQYLIKFSVDEEAIILDVQDPDNMVYNEIVSMLKKQCNITDNSEIYLYKDESFDGSQSYIVEWDCCSDEIKYKELNNPCRKCNLDWKYCSKCKKNIDFCKIVKEKFA